LDRKKKTLLFKKQSFVTIVVQEARQGQEIEINALRPLQVCVAQVPIQVKVPTTAQNRELHFLVA
jgi:hypothetical protein